MLRLAWPVLVEQLLVMLVGLTDTWLAGQFLQQHHLAAMNLMAYALWLLPSLFAAVGIGATALVARSVGARDLAAANRVTNQAFVLGMGLAVAVTAVSLPLAASWVRAMQLTGDAADAATRYLWIVLPATPAVAIEVVGNACLRGAGRMTASLAVMAVVNVVNVVVGVGLVLGLGPLPRLGWEGLAIGTASGYVVGGLLVAVLLFSGRTGLRLEVRQLRPDRAIIRRLLRIGLPGATDILAVIGCHLWFLGIVNQLGELASAAHGVAVRIESVAYLPGAAFQVAATTLTGQFLGAGDPHRAGRSVLSACLTAVALMTATGVVLFAAAGPIVGVFVAADQTEVARAAASLLRIVSFSMPALALTMVLSGALRGAGDTRWPLLLNFLGLLGVRIPAAYVLSHYLGYGVEGAWYAMLADLWIRCLLIGWRFAHGGWKQIDV